VLEDFVISQRAQEITRLLYDREHSAIRWPLARLALMDYVWSAKNARACAQRGSKGCFPFFNFSLPVDISPISTSSDRQAISRELLKSMIPHGTPTYLPTYPSHPRLSNSKVTHNTNKSIHQILFSNCTSTIRASQKITQPGLSDFSLKITNTEVMISNECLTQRS